MDIGHQVESYRFWDVVTQWARESVQHEFVMARALAKGVVRDGLRVQSVDPRWTNQGTFELRGAPFVGYVAREGALPIFIRASALGHLTDIVERAATPDPQALFEEFMTKQDFGAWLRQCRLRLPAFWFDATECQEGFEVAGAETDAQ
jgi:hypothetical protein